MAAAAAASGFTVLGFSSHAPLPFPTGWTMEQDRLHAYLEEIRRLAAFWAAAERPLEILAGLEIDWLEGIRSPRDSLFVEAGLDYCIGSVHFVRVPGADLFTVDCPAPDFAAGVSRAEGGAEAVWKAYFLNLSGMIEDGGFDILGHFDLVRKNNAGGRYFDESSRPYRSAALDAAALLRGKDPVIEINVGAMTRGAQTSPYPSLELLKDMRRMGLRVTITADAHAPDHLLANRPAAVELARAAGYRSVAVLSRGQAGGRDGLTVGPRSGAPLWSEIGIEEA